MMHDDVLYYISARQYPDVIGFNRASELYSEDILRNLYYPIKRFFASRGRGGVH